MSTAVAPGTARGHGFRGAEKGKQRADSEEPERNRTSGSGAEGFYVDEDEEKGEEQAGRRGEIGEVSSSENEDGEEEVFGMEEEEVFGMGLGTIESLEDELPIKRGLSNFYAGKSKSFTALSKVAAKAAAKEIAKPEDPFNKRRRLLAAWSRRRASCSSLVTTSLPPLLSLDHTVMEGGEGEEDEDRSNDGGDEDDNGSGRRVKAAASPRRFPPPKLHSASPKGATMTSSLNPNTSSLPISGLVSFRNEEMEAPISASQGAMRSLPGKVESLLSGPRNGLRLEEKNKLHILQGDLQGLIDNYLLEPSEVESPATTANFWMNDVRDLSYDIDDFLDELAQAGTSGSRISVVQTPKLPRIKIFRFPGKLKRRQWIADEISGFRTRVKEAIQRHKSYLGDCKWRPSRSCEHPAPSSCGQAAIRLIGVDSSIRQLSGWLANDGQPEHKVVSIVGAGGVGKTTLANEVYRKLGDQFECRAFVRTSRKPDMKRLLTSILSQVRRHQLPDSFEVHKMVFEINKHLQDKTYIIVIDELWASSTWDIVNLGLPKGNCCSRILITTEVDAIAQTCSADTSNSKYMPSNKEGNCKYIFKKEPLNEDQSRELLLSTVFCLQAECPQGLKEVSSEIIKRSGGLPLTINILASLLARQPASSIEQWNYIKNALSSDLSTNASLEEIKQVLNLSYDNLPHGLKACMLYLCLYEEDCVIWKDDLVKQWMAEGFVCAMEGSVGKEVAQSYFDELVNRGMIQPVDINCNDEILSCRVHHIVHHFIRYKSIEENFGIALDHSQSALRLADKVRRLALHLGNVQDATAAALASMRLSKVRSLAFSGFLKCMPSVVEFRFLQVLILKLWADPDNRSDDLIESDDLSGNITEPDELTDNLSEPGDLSYNLTEISELFRLRYFHLDACHMSVKLPTQMHRLKDLVAWEIKAEVTAVSSDIVDLPGLVYLSIPSKVRLPTGIGRMTSLCTLGVINLSKNSTENVMSLGELTNLQDLRLTCSTLQPDNLEKNLECLGLIVRKLSNLRCVTLAPAVSSHINIHDDACASSMSISWHGFIIEPLSPVPLQRLELSRRCCIFSSLPEWTNELTKLGVLKIALRKMSGEDFGILKALPSLASLSLFVWASPVRRIMFDNEGFRVLKYFKFVCPTPCLAFMDGAMPKVQSLKLGFNANRMERYSLVAAGLEHLTDLNEISTKIGGAGECDRKSVHSVLTDAISKHPSTPIINVQWLDWNFCGENLEEDSKEQADIRTYTPSESTSHLQNTGWQAPTYWDEEAGRFLPKLGTKQKDQDPLSPTTSLSSYHPNRRLRTKERMAVQRFFGDDKKRSGSGFGNRSSDFFQATQMAATVGSVSDNEATSREWHNIFERPVPDRSLYTETREYDTAMKQWPPRSARYLLGAEEMPVFDPLEDDKEFVESKSISGPKRLMEAFRGARYRKSRPVDALNRK